MEEIWRERNRGGRQITVPTSLSLSLSSPRRGETATVMKKRRETESRGENNSNRKKKIHNCSILSYFFFETRSTKFSTIIDYRLTDKRIIRFRERGIEVVL